MTPARMRREYAVPSLSGSSIGIGGGVHSTPGSSPSSFRRTRPCDFGGVHRPRPRGVEELRDDHVLPPVVDVAPVRDPPHARRGEVDLGVVPRQVLVRDPDGGGDAPELADGEAALYGRRRVHHGHVLARPELLDHARRDRVDERIVRARLPERGGVAVGLRDERREARGDLRLHELGVLELVEVLQVEDRGREPGHATRLASALHVEDVQDLARGNAPATCRSASGSSRGGCRRASRRRAGRWRRTRRPGRCVRPTGSWVRTGACRGSRARAPGAAAGWRGRPSRAGAGGGSASLPTPPRPGRRAPAGRRTTGDRRRRTGSSRPTASTPMRRRRGRWRRAPSRGCRFRSCCAPPPGGRCGPSRCCAPGPVRERAAGEGHPGSRRPRRCGCAASRRYDARPGPPRSGAPGSRRRADAASAQPPTAARAGRSAGPACPVRPAMSDALRGRDESVGRGSRGGCDVGNHRRQQGRAFRPASGTGSSGQAGPSYRTSITPLATATLSESTSA